jgi:hypothetical protein
LSQFNESVEKTNLELRNEIEALKQQLKTQSNTVTNINNGIVINIEGPVNLVAFGKEDLSRISQEEYIQILKKGCQAPLAMIQHIHLNDKYPEYQNLYISNFTGDSALAFTGKQWDCIDKKEAIDDMRTIVGDQLEEKYEELKEMNLLDAPTKRKFNNFIADRDDEEYIKRDKKGVNRLFYNSRDTVAKTKKRYELAQKNTQKVITA